MPDPLLAGLVQGAMSALLTFFLKRSVDWMRPKFSRNPGFWAPPLIAGLVSTSFLFCGHYLAETPEILTTIAVPTTVAVIYIFSYNIIRQRKLSEG
ncbi:MAG: hypothetical protein KUG69_03645 [Marinosulfonomonas sp.]|nr:hypothetical protein [Marinosulfonomonas sp.]